MTPFTQQQVEYILRFLTTAKLAGIDSVIFEPHLARGVRDGGAVVMIDQTAPDMPFDSMSINRIDVLLSGIQMMSTDSSIQIDAEIDSRVRDGEVHRFVRQLTMRTHRMEAGFKCTHPNVLRIPKRLKDTDALSIEVTPEILNFLVSGQRASKAPDFTIKVTATAIKYSMLYTTEDAITFSGPAAKMLDVISIPVEYKFTHKGLVDLLKHTSAPIIITKDKGFMSINIDGATVYIARNV